MARSASAMACCQSIAGVGGSSSPGANGSATAPAVALIASVPVIALTAFSRKEDEQKVLAAGFDEFLAKPLVPAALLQTVAAVNARRTSLPVV